MPRIAYAGDRQIGVEVLSFILNQGVKPLALMCPARDAASHANDLVALCSHLDCNDIWYGKDFQSPPAIEKLRSLDLDYIICVQFPLIIPQSILDIPREGVLNLHPAYLPYNRGWHTSVWAILDGTPYGATLHFMSEDLDSGDIVHQKAVEILPEDTGDSLYKRALGLEYEVFEEAWPQLVDRSYRRIPQGEDSGTAHSRKKLFNSNLQEIKLDETMTARNLINRMRAMTTNRLDEASYFIVDGKQYRLQINITPVSSNESA